MLEKTAAAVEGLLELMIPPEQMQGGAGCAGKAPTRVETVEGFYKAVCGAGWMTPAEFWCLHPREVLWLGDARKPVRMYGRMTEDEVREIYLETYGPA